MCHTNTVRVSRIRKRVAACGERMDPDGGSTGTRRTGDVVWVRRLSASDPGLGGELTVDSSRRESAMRAGGSFQDALNDPGLMCQLLPEHSEPEPGGGASMAAPPRRHRIQSLITKPAEGARAAAAFAAAPAGGERVHARGDADGRHPAIRDSPEFALPTDVLYDWSDVLVRIAAEEVGNGNFDETRFPNSVADADAAVAAPRRGDGRFGGSTPHLDATAGTPSPPFGARAPAFPGVPVYGQGGDGDGGFTLKHARYMQSAFEVLSDEEGSP